MPKRTIYYTKGALKYGIRIFNNCTEVNRPPSNGTHNWQHISKQSIFSYDPKYVHLTEESAIEHVDQMRIDAIEKLQNKMTADRIRLDRYMEFSPRIVDKRENIT